jgi:serine/alanine adding enzyme
MAKRLDAETGATTVPTRPAPAGGLGADRGRRLLWGGVSEENGITCRLAGSADGPSWNGFVRSRPEANLGHLWEWKGVIEAAYRRRGYYLVALQGEQWAGALPLIHMRGPLSGNRLVSVPFLDQAGILAATPEASRALWRGAIELATSLGAGGIELRAAAPPGASNSDRTTLVLRLPGNADLLWKSFKPKVRNQVRKAEKEGLRTVVAGSERLAEFYAVFARNMRDLGSPVHSRRFIEAVGEAFGASAKLYLTLAGDKVLGGGISLRFQQAVTVPWASSLREAFHLCPNHSLYWQVLRDAVAEGATLFDFGRSYLDSGTYRFKVQWGAEPLPLHWASFDGGGNEAPARHYRPSEHQRLTRLWSLLPLPIANWLGPIVRRQLSN